MQETEAVNNKTNKELADLRSLVSMNDPGETRKVITALKDINDAVDALAFDLPTSLGADFSATPFNYGAARGLLCALNLQPYWTALSFLRDYEFRAKLTAEDTVVTLVKIAVKTHLSCILLSFHVAIVDAPQVDRQLHAMYPLTKKAQHVAARWRSTTYEAISALKPVDVVALVNYAVKEVHAVLDATGGNSWREQNTIISTIEASLSKIIRDTIAFQKLTRQPLTEKNPVKFSSKPVFSRSVGCRRKEESRR